MGNADEKAVTRALGCERFPCLKLKVIYLLLVVGFILQGCIVGNKVDYVRMRESARVGQAGVYEDSASAGANRVMAHEREIEKVVEEVGEVTRRVLLLSNDCQRKAFEAGDPYGMSAFVEGH